MKISLGIIIVSLLLFLIFQKKFPKIAPIFICVHPICSIIVNVLLMYNGGISRILPSFFDGVGYGMAVDFILSLVVNFICVAPIILYYAVGNSLRGRNSFEIIQTAGIFSFDPEKYTIWELRSFEKQVKALQAGGANGQ